MFLCIFSIKYFFQTTIFVCNAHDKTKKSHLVIAAVIAISRNRNLQARRYAAHTFISRICKDATVPLLGVVVLCGDGRFTGGNIMVDSLPLYSHLKSSK